MATIEFSEDEVIRRTAKTLRAKESEVRDFLDAYVVEWLKLAREADYTPTAQPAPAPAPVKPAKSRSRAKPPTGEQTEVEVPV